MHYRYLIIIDPQKFVRVFGDKFSSVTGSGQHSILLLQSNQTRLFSITDAKYTIRNLNSEAGYDGKHSNHLKFLNERHVGHMMLFFNACTYIIEIYEIEKSPRLKNRYGNLQSCDNYKEVMISTNLYEVFNIVF